MTAETLRAVATELDRWAGWLAGRVGEYRADLGPASEAHRVWMLAGEVRGDAMALEDEAAARVAAEAAAAERVWLSTPIVECPACEGSGECAIALAGGDHRLDDCEQCHGIGKVPEPVAARVRARIAGTLDAGTFDRFCQGEDVHPF